MSQYYKDMFIEVREEKESDDGILDFVYEMVAKSSAKPLVTEMASDSAREFVLSLPKFTPTEAWGDPNSMERCNWWRPNHRRQASVSSTYRGSK